MTQKEARNKAIDYLYAATDTFYAISSKTTIDDKGTLSEYGYTDEECAEIQKELDFIMKRILKLKQPHNNGKPH